MNLRNSFRVDLSAATVYGGRARESLGAKTPKMGSVCLLHLPTLPRLTEGNTVNVTHAKVSL